MEPVIERILEKLETDQEFQTRVVNLYCESKNYAIVKRKDLPDDIKKCSRCGIYGKGANDQG